MKIRVEIVYALAHEQRIVELEMEQGACAADALLLSGLTKLPGGETGQFGIWGTPATAQTELRDGDRVEIYRDLAVDPKHARRLRAGRQGKNRRSN